MRPGCLGCPFMLYAPPSCYKRRMKGKTSTPKLAANAAVRTGAQTVAKPKWPAPSLVLKRRQKRSELMISELEAVALAMFHERGFSAVNVEEIAAEAQISTRTFYRYFATKEDV